MLAFVLCLLDPLSLLLPAFKHALIFEHSHLYTYTCRRSSWKPSPYFWVYPGDSTFPILCPGGIGIYVGENKVVHFTTGEKGYKSIQDSCLTCPDCGFHKHGSGVVLSCLDCFSGTGSLYLFQYGANTYVHISRLRSGTCTIAKSDPPQDVIYRAMYLLQNGFGNYSLLLNNCEDFALYCKTSLLVRNWDEAGSSGQVNGWVMSPLNVIVSSAVKVFRCSTPVAAVVGTGMHCLSRYATDIGVRKDVVKIKVEDMALLRS